MSYIGRGTESISNVEVLDNLTFNGSASYTLQKSSVNFVPSSANNLLISISGVVQQGNFSVSGSTITFDTTVSGSDTCDWILHYGIGLITTVADGAITEAKLGSNAVTTAKINNGAVSYAKTDGNFGKIGQVINATTTSTALTQGTSFIDSGLSVSITPSSTSSKIYVTYSSVMETNGTTNHKGTCAIFRDSTNINELSFKQQTNSEGGSPHFPISSQVLDSPNTTSSVTYKMKFKSNTNGVFVVSQIDNGEGSITVMEVLA